MTPALVGGGVRPLANAPHMALSLGLALFLQAAPDFFRSTGKIYVVVAVIAIVLAGLFAFLVLLDRRLTKLEDQINLDE